MDFNSISWYFYKTEQQHHNEILFQSNVQWQISPLTNCITHFSVWVSSMFHIDGRIAHCSQILFQICSRTSQYTWYSLIRPRTGGLSSSCEMIILRSKSHGEIIRVCRGIFTTALRKKNIIKFSIKQPHLTSTAHRLLSDRLLCWKEPFEPFYFFLDHFCAGPQRFLFFRHANAKLPPQHWTLIVVENIEFTILHFWVMRETLESSYAPLVASRFPLFT